MSPIPSACTHSSGPGDTSPASVRHAVARPPAPGFDLLELTLHDSVNLDVAGARRELEAAGLAVACSRRGRRPRAARLGGRRPAGLRARRREPPSYLGSGHLDFGAFFHALADISYTGPVTFESFSSAMVSPGLSNDLAVWRNLWDDGDDLLAGTREGSSPASWPPARTGDRSEERV